jgi:hypothetical protein
MEIVPSKLFEVSFISKEMFDFNELPPELVDVGKTEIYAFWHNQFSTRVEVFAKNTWDKHHSSAHNITVLTYQTQQGLR